jgi:NADH-quinone oxidoreductase subunit M
MPVFAAIFGVMMLSSIGLPTLNGFIGELLILQGVFVVSMMWAVVAGVGIVLGAAYMLWLFQRTMFGKIDNPKNLGLTDLSLREVAVFAPLIILAVWIGLYPSPFISRLETSVDRVMVRVSPDYAARTPAAASDCADNVPTSEFTLAPCGPEVDQAEEAAGKPAVDPDAAKTPAPPVQPPPGQQGRRQVATGGHD